MVAEAFEELINELLASKSPKNGTEFILIIFTDNPDCCYVRWEQMDLK